MQLTFLEADVPLTKKFEKLDDGSLSKDSYPFVKKFTSLEEQADSIEEFCDALKRHALANRCLLKGVVSRQLREESRSGSTDSYAPTRWVVFDIDGMDNIFNAEQFISTILPPEFQDASYIVQHSASSGLSSDGFRAHIFFVLSRDISPTQIKLWLQHKNLDEPMLKSQLRLSSNAITLRYPLDITVCQNDKLIYIAPPTCVGFEDPMQDQRITLTKKGSDVVNYGFPAVDKLQVDRMIGEEINTLRVAQGLKKKTIVYKTGKDGTRYLDPKVLDVTGDVTEFKVANGFVRLNINGGDSWAYYHAVDNPLYLKNFKGEPVVLLRDFLPEYYKTYSDALRQSVDDSDRPRPFVFRDRATDKYMYGMTTPDDRLEFLYEISSKEKIGDAFANYGEAPPDPIPEWDVVFDPTSMIVLDRKRRVYNCWQATEAMMTATAQQDIPPVTRKILQHVLAQDDACFDHFLNWLAYIYQNRTKTGTAWVLHGTQGTGKGLLFNNILTPIFGLQYCTTRLLSQVGEKFNDYIERTIILNIDEARISDELNEASKIVNQLKSWITEPEIAIRGMRQNQRTARSYTNFIFASNEYDAIRIAEDDRRFNVAPRQEERIDITSFEVDALGQEVLQFAGFLMAYEVDKEQAHTAINNDAKAAMRKASQTSVEQFAQAIATGDLDYFVDGLDDDTFTSDPAATAEFKKLVEQWVEDYREDRECVLTKKDAFTAFKALFDTRDMRLKKFTRMMEHKNLTFEGRYGTTAGRKRGRLVEWQATPEAEQAWRFPPKLAVVSSNQDIVDEIKGSSL